MFCNTSKFINNEKMRRKCTLKVTWNPLSSIYKPTLLWASPNVRSHTQLRNRWKTMIICQKQRTRISWTTKTTVINTYLKLKRWAQLSTRTECASTGRGRGGAAARWRGRHVVMETTPFPGPPVGGAHSISSCNFMTASPPGLCLCECVCVAVVFLRPKESRWVTDLKPPSLASRIARSSHT